MPTQDNEVTLSQSEAKNVGASGKTAQTNIIVVSGPFMEILIGGSYENHPYGHAALRVFIEKGREFVYDYGRYRLTWGVKNSEGEGILKVWNSFTDYIMGENNLGRTTTGYVYYLEKQQAEAIIAYFQVVVALGKAYGKPRKSDEGIIIMTPYRTEDYHAIHSNCTTVTLSGIKQSGINVYHNPEKYQELRGLSSVKKMAAKTQSYSEYWIFMPFDLQAMLEDAKTEGVGRTYDKKKLTEKNSR